MSSNHDGMPPGRKSFVLNLVITLFILLCVGFQSAKATTIVWDHDGPGNAWETAANWNPDQVPGSLDDAVVDTAGDGSGNQAVTLISPASVVSLTLGGISNPNLTIQNPGSLGFTGASIVHNTATLNLRGASLGGSGSLQVDGTITLVPMTDIARIDVPIHLDGTLAAAGALNRVNGAVTTTSGALIQFGSEGPGSDTDLIFENGFVNNGIISMSQILGNPPVMTLSVVNGVLVNAPGGRITFSNPSPLFRYRVELDNQGHFRSSMGHLSKPGSSQKNSGLFELSNNPFLVELDSGAIFDNTGEIRFGGHLTVNGGDLVSGGVILMATPGAILETSHAVRITAGGSLVAESEIRGVLDLAGRLELGPPESVPVTLNVTGAILMRPTARTVIDIEEGLFQVTNDRIDVSGHAELEGTLDIRFYPSPLPNIMAGDSILVMTYASFSRGFRHFEGYALPNGLFLNPVFTPTAFYLVASTVSGAPEALEAPRFAATADRGAIRLTAALESEADIAISIFDIQGRQVGYMVPGLKPPGVHTWFWNASRLPRGVYMARLEVRGSGQMTAHAARVTVL